MAPHFSLHRSQSSQSHRSLSAIIASSISRANSPDSHAPQLSSAKPIEEETLPKYSPRTFYSAKIGERVNNNRYEIIAKLGYGMTATVWLARDLHASPGKNCRRYVTIKINVNSLTDEFLKGRREIARKLMTTNPEHPGYTHVRFMLDSFTLKGKYGEHLCLVYDVLREPIDECRDKYLGGAFSSAKLRVLLPALLQGLDYMHSECHVVHTDLKADNIMMGLGSDPNAVLEKFAAHQQTHPTPRKPPDSHDGHIVYQSCSDLLLVGDKDNGKSMNDSVLASAKITDIGLAEFGDRGLQHKAIQSNAFTCPEVLIGAGWSYPADIWNIGVMLWDLIETNGLFDHIKTQPGQYKAEEHLALMIVLLGFPPKKFLDRGLKTAKYFDYDKETEEYSFRNQKKLKEYKNVISWDACITHMQGDNKASFIDFAQKMITWDPEDRWTAKQLLEHPWLKSRPGSVTCTSQDFSKAHRTLSENAERDAELARESTAASLASSIAASDVPDYFSKARDGSPPKQGISQRTTNTSFTSMDSFKESLPSLVVTPSR